MPATTNCAELKIRRIGVWPAAAYIRPSTRPTSPAPKDPVSRTAAMPTTKLVDTVTRAPARVLKEAQIQKSPVRRPTSVHDTSDVWSAINPAMAASDNAATNARVRLSAEATVAPGVCRQQTGSRGPAGLLVLIRCQQTFWD